MAWHFTMLRTCIDKDAEQKKLKKSNMRLISKQNLSIHETQTCSWSKHEQSLHGPVGTMHQRDAEQEWIPSLTSSQKWNEITWSYSRLSSNMHSTTKSINMKCQSLQTQWRLLIISGRMKMKTCRSIPHVGTTSTVRLRLVTGARNNAKLRETW